MPRMIAKLHHFHVSQHSKAFPHYLIARGTRGKFSQELSSNQNEGETTGVPVITFFEHRKWVNSYIG